MSLNLDNRQRAMLREMGVYVWLPAVPAPVDAVAGPSGGSLNAIENRASHATKTRATGQNSLKNQAVAGAARLPQALAPTGMPNPSSNAAGAASSTHAAALAQPSAQPAASLVPATHRAVAPALDAHNVATVADQSRQATTSSRKPAGVSVRTAGPTHVTALPEGIAAMDWLQLADTVAHCQACAMCFGRSAPVLAAPAELTPCDWLVLGDPPDEPQERLGLPFVEEAGVLLGNMLRAVGVTRFVPGSAQGQVQTQGTAPETAQNRARPDPIAALPTEPAQRAYLTHVLKCRPALMRAPAAAELATCANYLRREIALTQPKVILAMGRFAMQLLLSETPPESARLPLGKLRGQEWQFAGVPVVVTYPPSYLLRSGQDKGKAWADLCLALEVVQGKRPG